LSRSLASRLKSHGGQGPCKGWIAELRAEGRKPILEVPLSGLTYAQAEAAEQRLTAMHGLMHPGRLLNVKHRVTSFFGPLSPISNIFLKGGLIVSPI
jgi:hypothetical protein